MLFSCVDHGVFFFIFNFFRIAFSSSLVNARIFCFLMILCKYESGGKLIACTGQVLAQVTQPTLQFNGSTTTGLLLSKSYL